MKKILRQYRPYPNKSFHSPFTCNQNGFNSRLFSTSTKQDYDAVIIGGGHNGLVCANYLAKENMKVLVLERRDIVGGAAVSEEVFPGYTFSRASYVLSLLRKKVIDEIFPKNWREDVVLYKRRAPSFTPTKNGKYLLLTVDDEVNFKEISKFSRQDALNFKDYMNKLDEIVDLVNPIIDTAPSDNILELL